MLNEVLLSILQIGSSIFIKTKMQKLPETWN